MNFSEYQKESRATAQYDNMGDEFVYPTLGLVGEVGEVAEKIKKLMRNHNVNRPSEMTEEQKGELKKELGDVLWYLAQISTECGFDLEEVAQSNINKLRDRMERGVLKSQGDNR